MPPQDERKHSKAIGKIMEEELKAELERRERLKDPFSTHNLGEILNKLTSPMTTEKLREYYIKGRYSFFDYYRNFEEDLQLKSIEDLKILNDIIGILLDYVYTATDARINKPTLMCDIGKFFVAQENVRDKIKEFIKTEDDFKVLVETLKIMTEIHYKFENAIIQSKVDFISVMEQHNFKITYFKFLDFNITYFKFLDVTYDLFKDEYDLTVIAENVKELPSTRVYEKTVDLCEKIKKKYSDYLRVKALEKIGEKKELPEDVLDRISSYLGAPRNTRKKYSYDSDDEKDKYSFKDLTYKKKPPRRNKGQSK